MVSITDCVVEGLKYPFNDIKKLLSFGALFVVINVITIAMFQLFANFIVKINRLGFNHVTRHISKLPMNDFFILVGLAVVAFVISLFIMGYLYDVMKFSIDRKNDLPGFGDILNLLLNGLKYFLVSFIYNIVPAIVLIAGVEILSADYLVLIVSLILYIICNFLLIMGLANMVDSGKFTKAFDLKEITDKISNLGWIKYVGIIIFTLIVYAIIMSAIGVVMMFVTLPFASSFFNLMIITVILSLIQGLLISPYISVFFNRLYGSVYREALK